MTLYTVWVDEHVLVVGAARKSPTHFVEITCYTNMISLSIVRPVKITVLHICQTLQSFTAQATSASVFNDIREVFFMGNCLLLD